MTEPRAGRAAERRNVYRLVVAINISRLRREQQTTGLHVGGYWDRGRPRPQLSAKRESNTTVEHTTDFMPVVHQLQPTYQLQPT